MISLGVETSCDETSVAVIQDGKIVLSNIIASSLKLHKIYQGIIPEIASRAHVECISAVTQSALEKAGKKLKDLDLICVTSSPGLIGSLLVGISFAGALAFSLNKPIIEVNHLEAHLYANFLTLEPPVLPCVGLVVSGGHTSLFLVLKNFDFKLLGATLDDAAGEAFDKTAKIMGLGYPGGPAIEKLALRGDAKKIKFSCSCGASSRLATAGAGLNFSFSGIKTAVLHKIKSPKEKGRCSKKDIAAGFQESVVKVLVDKAFAACSLKKVRSLVVGGGVACNGYLRKSFQEEGARRGIRVYFPPVSLSLDNAAMIAGLGTVMFKKQKR